MKRSQVEQVEKIIYLGQLITSDGKCEEEANNYW